MKFMDIGHMGKYLYNYVTLLTASNAEDMADLFKESSIMKQLKNRNIV